jgi:hypothetical protein
MNPLLNRPIDLFCTVALLVEDVYSTVVLFARNRAENFEHVHKAALLPI